MDNNEKTQAVQRMKDYILENLTKEISLKRLAKAANYSPWYAARIFKEHVGKTPFEYIRAIRLSQAAVQLRNDEVRITDVAFDFVFDSHEGFTRAFSKQFGMTPRSYCKNAPLIKFILPSIIRDDYLTVLKGVDLMSENSNVNPVFIQVVDRPARKLILKRGVKATHYYEYCDEVDSERVWDVLCGIQEALYEPIGMWMPESLIKPGTSIYTQGVEVPADYEGDIPDGFEIIDLPACKMMVFQGEPYDDENYEHSIGALWKLMKTYDPTIYGFEWADGDGPRFQLAPMGYRGYIEARPVRQISGR